MLFSPIIEISERLLHKLSKPDAIDEHDYLINVFEFSWVSWCQNRILGRVFLVKVLCVILILRTH